MSKTNAYLDSIVRYYDATWIDYRVLWLNRRNRSVHFGYFDGEITNHDDALERLNHVMADRVGIGPEDHVLDAGCGQGGSSVWLSVNRGATVDGVTLVPHQVAIARKTALKQGVADKTNFQVANYCHTPFADGQFSVVWACESLCHAEEKADFYKEVFRVLRPGGRLVVAEYIRKDRPSNEEGEHLLHQWLHRWSIKDIDTWPEHEGNMKQAGFERIVLQDCSANVMPSLRHLCSMSTKLLPLGKVLLKVGLRNQVNHGNHLASITQYKAFEKGYWFYGIFSATKPLE